MSGAGDLYQLARQQTRDTLRNVLAVHGAAHAGIVADGWMRGIHDEIKEFLGPEGAYGMFQRHADRAAEPLLSNSNSSLKGDNDG